MKGPLVGLVLLLVVAVVGDRVALSVAEGQVAQQAQASGGLSQEPDVSIGGFPFLTQAVSGRYDDVRLRTSGAVSGTQVERLDVRLRGVRLPLSDALSGDVARVPVDSLAGDVVLPYAYLSEQAPDGLTVSAAGDRIRVRGTVRVLGQEVSAAATSRVRLSGDRVVVTAESVQTGAGAVDAALSRALGDRFDFRVRVPELPYGLELTGLRVTPSGVALAARSGPTVLTR